MPQAKGEKIATYGLTEPNAGSDAVGIQTTAVRKDGCYVLNGEKVWISLADVADNFLVIAVDRSGEEEGARPQRPVGLHRGALVQGLPAPTRSRRSGASWPATPAASPWTTSRCRSRTGSARRARGSRSRCSPWRTGATRWPPGPPGLIRACLDASIRYARDRKTFGVPIGDHQLVEGDDRADGLRLRRGAAALAARRLAEERGTPQQRARPRSRSGSPPSRASAPPATACRSTAATATPTSTRPAASTATARPAVIYEGTREIHKLDAGGLRPRSTARTSRGRVELPRLQALTHHQEECETSMHRDDLFPGVRQGRRERRHGVCAAPWARATASTPTRWRSSPCARRWRASTSTAPS